jgi:hypothetical protein
MAGLPLFHGKGFNPLAQRQEFPQSNNIEACRFGKVYYSNYGRLIFAGGLGGSRFFSFPCGTPWRKTLLPPEPETTPPLSPIYAILTINLSKSNVPE